MRFQRISLADTFVHSDVGSSVTRGGELGQVRNWCVLFGLTVAVGIGALLGTGAAFGQHGTPMVVSENVPVMGYPPQVGYATCAPCVPLRFDVRADFLSWWIKGQNVPSLVTTSPLDTPRDDAGILGHPDTTVLFGGDELTEDPFSGIRFAITGWLDPCRNSGLEFSYAYLDWDGANFDAAGSGNVILARPFVNADGFRQDAELISFPDEVSGSVSVEAQTRFETAEAIYRRAFLSECDRRAEFLIGYRYGKLQDRVIVTENLESLGQTGGIIPGTTFDLRDAFETENTFNGVVVGMIATQTMGAWDLEVLGKVALGGVRSTANIAGSTVIDVPDQSPETTQGGLLALPTNIGEHTDDAFGGMTEVGVRLSYEFAPCWRASLGYTCIYWHHVARAGEQIDTTLDLTQLPPGEFDEQTRPAFHWVTDGFWAQGLNAGLECRF
jgi:hypothetical protein